MPVDPISTEDLSRLTTLMFAAATDSARWNDFLHELAAAAGDIRVRLFGYDMVGGVTLDLLHYGYDPDFMQAYRDYYGAMNAWAPGFFANQPGEIVHSESMCSRERMLGTEFYDDWVRPQEDILCGGGSILFKDGHRMFVGGGNIRSRDQDHLQDRWLNLVGLLVPHLQQAFEISRALAGKSLASAALAEAGVEPQSAVLLLNERLQPLYANDDAQRMLADGQVIRIDLQGRVAFRGARATAALSRSMQASDERGATLSSSFETTSGFPGGPRYVCRVAHVDPSGQDTSPFGTFIGVSGRCALLTISAARIEEDANARLVGLHGLTRSEAFVADRLASGLTLSQIADERAVSIHTVRNQVKSAMSRLGVRRQSDLVRIVTETRAAPPH